MQSAVIDRFEGDYAVLLVAGSDAPINVPRQDLPEGLREGDYLKIELDDGKVIQVEYHQPSTEVARQRIQAKLDRLRRGEHLSDGDPE
jgi:hypothetical protein